MRPEAGPGGGDPVIAERPQILLRPGLVLRPQPHAAEAGGVRGDRPGPIERPGEVRMRPGLRIGPVGDHADEGQQPLPSPEVGHGPGIVRRPWRWRILAEHPGRPAPRLRKLLGGVDVAFENEGGARPLRLEDIEEAALAEPDALGLDDA